MWSLPGELCGRLQEPRKTPEMRRDEFLGQVEKCLKRWTLEFGVNVAGGRSQQKEISHTLLKSNQQPGLVRRGRVP